MSTVMQRLWERQDQNRKQAQEQSMMDLYGEASKAVPTPGFAQQQADISAQNTDAANSAASTAANAAAGMSGQTESDGQNSPQVTAQAPAQDNGHSFSSTHVGNNPDGTPVHVAQPGEMPTTQGDQYHQAGDLYATQAKRLQWMLDNAPSHTMRYDQVQDLQNQLAAAHQNAIAAYQKGIETTHMEASQGIASIAAGVKSGSMPMDVAITRLSQLNSKIPNGMNFSTVKQGNQTYVQYFDADKNPVGKPQLLTPQLGSSMIDYAIKYSTDHLGSALNSQVNANALNDAAVADKRADVGLKGGQEDWYRRRQNSGDWRLTLAQSKPIGFTPENRAVYNVNGQQVVQDDDGNMLPYSGPMAATGTGKGLVPQVKWKSDPNSANRDAQIADDGGKRYTVYGTEARSPWFGKDTPAVEDVRVTEDKDGNVVSRVPLGTVKGKPIPGGMAPQSQVAAPPQKAVGLDTPAPAYVPGTVQKGYRFKGGDPTKKENWEKV